MVVAVLEACESVALTVVVPPFSETEESDRARVTVAAPSLSMTGRVMPGGLATPLAPDTVASTSTALIRESVVTRRVAMVTVPPL